MTAATALPAYRSFLERKRQLGGDHGFAPSFMPGFLFDFQAALVEWAAKKGRAADGEFYLIVPNRRLARRERDHFKPGLKHSWKVVRVRVSPLKKYERRQ